MDIDAEKALVEKAKTDASAFGQLYDEYFKRIFGYTLRRTADFQRAQDITSEVFLKALKNIRSFQWRGVPFSAWLYRIASNEIAYSYKRNSHYHPSLIVSTVEDVCVDGSVLANVELENLDEHLALQECLVKLPLKYQEVIALRYFEDKNLAEIAQILGKSENTVKSLLYRGIDRLKVLIEG